MHRCLMISEIILNIANEIEVNYERNEPWNTLAKLARTCRVFSEPALNSLWRVQSSLEHLLRTMPEDLWWTDVDVLRPRRPIKPTDWSRFQTYASRIHHFICDELWDDSPSHECLQALVCAKPPNIVSFFPHLHSLGWSGLVKPSDEVFQGMPFFMSAATKKISFSLEGLRVTGLSLVQSMLYNFPELRHVDIQLPDTLAHTEADDALAELFSYGQHLCGVKVGGVLPQPIIKHLAGFQNLKRLEVELDDRSLPARLSGFHALEDLRVVSKTFRITSRLIPMLRSPLDTAFFITLGSVVKPQELANTFELMSLHCSHAHLRKLTVQTLLPLPQFPGAPMDHSVLQHLFVFSNLSHVELQVDAPTSFDNAAMREMASAWPQLAHLTLGTCGWFRKTLITPAGLIPLLCLPRLTTISICIDASAVDTASQHVAPQPPGGALRSLDLQFSIINDAGLMAVFLSKFAPNLEHIWSWTENATRPEVVSRELAQEYRSRWKEVARLVPLFAAVREEERGARASS
ncbi:hypothetical protein HWV62_20616 [Athelia sp. TMB]|nr:hypothetical protein HWV62_20616 [Athelia sp. TMB]